MLLPTALAFTAVATQHANPLHFISMIYLIMCRLAAMVSLCLWFQHMPPAAVPHAASNSISPKLLTQHMSATPNEHQLDKLHAVCLSAAA
jgi:hypothetical protein